MLTHMDENGLPSMVDVSEKTPTRRKAHAQAKVIIPREIASLFQNGEIPTKKGGAFQTAIIAGTCGAKQTSSLIPFCHPLSLEGIKIEIELSSPEEISIDCRVNTFAKTGVEMEALTGATVAALTLYDMLKSLSHHIRLENICLVQKTGGKSDFPPS